MQIPFAHECRAGTSRVFDKTLPPRTGLPRHAHARAAITLVMAGRYDETFDHGPNQCQQWTVQYKPPGVAHETTSPSGTRMVIVALNADDGRLPERSTPAVLDCGAATATAIAIHRAAFTAERFDLDLHDLIARLLQLLEPAANARDTPPSWLTEVHDQVQRLESPPPTMSRMAETFRVHPVYLARVFRRHYGCSIGDHLRRCRVDRAVQTLVESDVPLARLAHDLGYCDQSHFTNGFRHVLGCTPGQVRDWARSLAV